MVCKEDVLLWFKDLDGYKRIDVLYELIAMCIPFEVRILGSFIEEVGKTSFQELRGSALIANDLDKLTKDTSLMKGLIEASVRHRVIIYLSLLSSSNWKCANWFYKTLLRTEWLDTCVLRGNIEDNNLLSELLLLFTIGMRHPAFSFEQKMYFGDLLERLLSLKDSKEYVVPNQLSSNCRLQSNYNNTNSFKGFPDMNAKPVEVRVHQCHGIAHSINGPTDVHQTIWNRPGFAGTISGAPEVAPFPPPPISPLVSQPTSPCRSRATSPHKIYGTRSLQQSTQVVGDIPEIPPDPLPLPTSNVAPHSELKTNNDELNHIADDKLRDTPWLNSVNSHKDVKPPNGIRIAAYNKVPTHQYFLEQIQALNLEGANSLHCSSSSSSTNSLNQSPPDTPATTPAVPHHGPGRGEKPRTNGMPLFGTTGPPICDTAPPTSVLNNCSVPYPSYPSVPPNSTPSQVPPRSTHCYNCGAIGHTGSECSGQTIEDITQKKAYSVDYNSTLPDADK